jgi:hypothetical protein
MIYIPRVEKYFVVNKPDGSFRGFIIARSQQQAQKKIHILFPNERYTIGVQINEKQNRYGRSTKPRWRFRDEEGYKDID